MGNFVTLKKTFMSDDIELNPGPSQNKNSQTRITLHTNTVYTIKS